MLFHPLSPEQQSNPTVNGNAMSAGSNVGFSTVMSLHLGATSWIWPGTNAESAFPNPDNQFLRFTRKLPERRKQAILPSNETSLSYNSLAGNRNQQQTTSRQSLTGNTKSKVSTQRHRNGTFLNNSLDRGISHVVGSIGRRHGSAGPPGNGGSSSRFRLQ